MNHIDQALAEVFQQLTLTEGHRQQLSDRQSALTGVLRALVATPKIVPIGSYARGTLIPPGRDADVMFVWPDAPANAREALTRLHGLLAGRYTKTELRLQKHSVGIFYELGPTLDVVPAREVAGGYVIPELDDPNNATSDVRWITTTPEADADRVRRANDRTGGIAARLVAALKRANARHTTKLKSIHLERVVIGAIESGAVNERTISGAVSQSLVALSEVVGTEADQRAWNYLTPTARTEIRNRYATERERFRKALWGDDVELAGTVIPLR